MNGGVALHVGGRCLRRRPLRVRPSWRPLSFHIKRYARVRLRLVCNACVVAIYAAEDIECDVESGIVVRVFCVGGAPSASVSAVLTHTRSSVCGPSAIFPVCRCRFYGSHTITFKRAVSTVDVPLCLFRCTTTHHAIWCSVPIDCSSAVLSFPSHKPPSQRESNVFDKCYQSSACHCVSNHQNCDYDMCRFFSHTVLVEPCSLWKRVYCHAACRVTLATIGCRLW